MSIPRQAIAIALLLGLAPSIARAQAAARTAGDAPSRNRETRIQHDSLAVHRVRTPKAKPATRSTAAAGIDPRKFAGKPEPAARALPAETPLPVKARTTKP